MIKKSSKIFLWFIAAGAVCPSFAYAYLDPGTGSMLVSAIIGISATLFYLLKNSFYKVINLFYRFSGRAAPKSDGAIVFYSEGRQYWNTFRPVLEEFEAQGKSAVYLASDEKDPALTREWKHITTRHIGMGNRGFAVLNMLEADICVMTTPGLDVLQIHRSPGVKHYCHMVHAVTDAAIYKLYSFDYFDSVMCSGPHQIKSLRYFEKLRNMPQKMLFETGCCHVDAQADAAEEIVKSRTNENAAVNNSNKPRVLFAPTWGANGLLKRFGAGLILPLAKVGYPITLRPHPQSFISEQDMLNEIRTALAPYPNVSWDSSPSSLEAMLNSDVMVSDFSGVVFDYAFILERPAITVKFELDLRGLDGMDLPWPAWEMDILPELGAQLDPNTPEKLPELIAALPAPEKVAEKLRNLRTKYLYNYRQSGKVAAKQLIALHEEIAAGKNTPN